MRPSLTDINPAEVTTPPPRNDECWKDPGADKNIVSCLSRGVAYILSTFDAYENVDYAGAHGTVKMSKITLALSTSTHNFCPAIGQYVFSVLES